jgi:glutamate---cysteine ligase / carboxylate-amine ligase
MLTDSKTFGESIRRRVSPAGDQFLDDPGETSPAELPRGRPGSRESEQPSCVSVVDAVALEWHVRRVFDRTAPFTVGAEEELLLLDADTERLAPIAPRALALLEDDRRFVPELRSAQIECVTPVCCTAADAARELSYARGLASARLAGLGRIVAVAVHPTARAPGPITISQRYEQIVADNPQIERRLLACGLHVHVAVGGAERSLAVYNAFRGWLPEIVALGANAPFHEGLDSGLATVRPGMNRLLPRSGVPPAFRSWAAYADFCAWAASGGVAPDASYHWWDLRLHPIHGTIEVRAADVQTRIRDTATMIALVQSLAFSLAARYDAGETLPVFSGERIAENMWLAARDGLNGSLIAETGERRRTSIRLCALADHLLPAATELGCSEELLGIERMVREGGGATRQRERVRSFGLDGLCDWLASETIERLAQPSDSAAPLTTRPPRRREARLRLLSTGSKWSPDVRAR